MGKFNSKVKRGTTKTVNDAGGVAYKQNDKTALVSALLTSFVTDTYYGKADNDLSGLIDVMNRVDPEFCAKAIVYARKEFGMRSVSHATASELASRASGTKWGTEFYKSVVKRPDDMTEIFSYYKANVGKSLPNSMKKGFGKVLANMDEYQLAKYQGKGNSVSLIDVVNMVRPKGTEALKKLMNGTISPADTWEVGMSKAGKDEGAKAEVWGKLLSEGKLGYFALVRNLRNIINQAPDSVSLACEQLVNERAIKRSLLMPFRFYTAIKEIREVVGQSHVQKVVVALNKAMEISLCNVPEFKGETLVVVDDSGSMGHRVSSDTLPIDIASLFASAILKKNPDADYMQFSNEARFMTLNTGDSLGTMASSIRGSIRGGGTNFHSIFAKANKVYDRVIILSDMQGWTEAGGGYYSTSPVKSYNEYCKKYSCKPMIYSFDLAGRSTTQFAESNVACLSGFSDKIFDIMGKLETNKNALVDTIESYEF